MRTLRMRTDAADLSTRTSWLLSAVRGELCYLRERSAASVSFRSVRITVRHWGSSTPTGTHLRPVASAGDSALLGGTTPGRTRMNRRDFTLTLLGAAGAAALDARRAWAWPRAMRPQAGTQPPRLRVNGTRLMDHLAGLAEFGKNPQGGVSRVAYSDADRQGREYAMGLMRAAKLDVRIDAAGNIIGRRAGRDRRL